eukprot:CAMPEP_0172771910 /NCGR_PEP_ID=MMETSP1074-20121228/191443_1 /TAXON_ID=2916 /ORGANISM="Ceratium fusus, Strain PA161109" /LENGTH=47 /DNA_ID= /DNA_START= /DNA_END= /DNA_ORIENTATION=
MNNMPGNRIIPKQQAQNANFAFSIPKGPLSSPSPASSSTSSATPGVE